MKRNETVENMIKEYGREAFQNHREEVYAAIKAICLCAEFLQAQEDWGGRRAIPVRKDCPQDHWKKYCSERYDRRLRGGEIRRLNSELDSQELWMGEKIPLKNFLRQGLILMIQEAGLFLFDQEQWMGLMEAQMVTDQYTDFRVFQEAVYVWGLFEIMKFQDGTNCHWFEGDFRDGEYLLKTLRFLIPEDEQGNYDDYCAGLLKEIEQKRMDTMKRAVEERDRRLERGCREKGGIPVLDLFRQKMREMKDSEFEQFVAERLDEDRWKDHTEWDDKVNLRGKKLSRVQKVAELFIHGGRESKRRLFQYLSEEERIIVMELWMMKPYPSTAKELARRLALMLEAARPDWRWESEDSFLKVMMESLERIMGRTVTREEIGYFSAWSLFDVGEMEGIRIWGSL